MTIANPAPVRSLHESEQLRVLRYARTCYDHLAGSLGASLTNRLFELGWIERIPGGRAVRVTPDGAAGFLAEFGLEVKIGKERV